MLRLVRSLSVAVSVVLAFLLVPGCGAKVEAATDAGSTDAGAVDAGPLCVVDGGVTITTPDDWAKFVQSGCAGISGTLAITGTTVTELSPPATALVSVGSLQVLQNAHLVTLSLPALTTITEGIEIDGASALVTLDLPLATKLTGDLKLRDTSALLNVRLPKLETLDGVLSIMDANVLTTLALPALTTTQGLDINHAWALTTLDVPLLTQANSLSLGDTGNLDARLPRLEALITSLNFSYNSNTTTLSLPALTTVAGNLSLHENSALKSLSLPALRTVRGTLSITSNWYLRQCVVDAIKGALTDGPTTYESSSNNGTPNTCP